MKKGFVFLFTMIFLLSACAPQAESIRFGNNKSGFGPRFSDTDLRQRLKQSDHFVADLTWSGTIATAAYFRQAQNLNLLGKITSNPTLSQKGVAWIKKFYQTKQTTAYLNLSQTPYATLMAAQTRQEVQSTLADIRGDITKAQTSMKSRIHALGTTFPWAKQQVRIPVLLSEAQNFVDLLIMQLPLMGLSKQVEEGLRKELIAQTKPYFDDMKNFVDSFYRSHSFTGSLNLIKQVIAKFKVTLDSDLLTEIQQAQTLGQEIDVMNDPQGALTVLVDIWKMLTPEDRIKYFKSENATLYDFLSNQDDKELQCLRTPGCNGGLFHGIAKKVFVLPKIKDYGVLKIQFTLNKATLEYLVNRVESFAVDFVRDLPGIFSTNIEKGLIAKAQELEQVQKNYEPYIKDLLGEWAQRNLAADSGKVAGFEVSSLNINLAQGKSLSLEGVGTPADLKANTAGSAMMAKALLMENLDTKDEMGLQTALSQVNKLITIGGYRDINDKLIPALLSPVEQVKSPLDLMNISAVRYSYRIPDRIRLQDPFHADASMNYEKNFSAASFAEQIEGLSHMLKVTADWRASSFDRFLGPIQAQDLTAEIQSPALKRSLFPKDMFFALNLGDVAVLLKDITKKATPVFLVSLDNNVIWADEYSQSSETTVMGGIVDIKDGQKSNVVQAKDVSKFLLAISEFLKATDGVENTKSSILRDKDEHGASNLDALIEGRDDLKKLVIALANFISNQMISESGFIQGTYYLKQHQRSNDPNIQVEEQIMAIRALQAAWELTHIDAYLWSAQEIYYSMNKNLFNVNEHFYVNGDGSKLDFPQTVTALVTLLELRPHLPAASQAQMQTITAPWLEALNKL